MTTLAWDGSTLAADRLIVEDDGAKRSAEKVWDLGDWVYAGCGVVVDVLNVKEWFNCGCPWDARPPITDSYILGIAVSKKEKKAYVVHGKELALSEISEKCYAAGSGKDYARMAMRLGKSAVEAIELASEFDVYTGLGTNAVKVRMR